MTFTKNSHIKLSNYSQFKNIYLSTGIIQHSFCLLLNINFDSTNYGNYNNSSFNLNRGKYAQTGSLSSEWNDYKKDLENSVINSRKQSNSESDYSIIYTTGASDTNCVMNIYDLGGNVWEWTLENGQTPSRANVNRGGAYNGTGLNSPISTRNRSTSIGSSFHNVGFRVTMY